MRLAPVVRQYRCWNRVALHKQVYSQLRADTPLGSQMCCNAIFSVCKAYKSQKQLGRIRKGAEAPVIRFDRASIHYDQRTYSLKGDTVSLYTLTGRVVVSLRMGARQRRILESGIAKEAELVLRGGRWFFHWVVESQEPKPLACGPAMGVDVGETISPPSVWARSLGAGHCATGALPCVVVFSPTAARAQDRSSGRSPARKRGV